MKSARIIIALAVASFPAAAAEGWVTSDLGDSSRVVRVEMSLAGRVLEKWSLPVGKNVPETAERIQTKVIVLPAKRPKGLPAKLFTETWLGSVDEKSAWLRMTWYAAGDRDSRRLINDLWVADFGSAPESTITEGLKVTVLYEPAS